MAQAANAIPSPTAHKGNETEADDCKSVIRKTLESYSDSELRMVTWFYRQQLGDVMDDHVVDLTSALEKQLKGSELVHMLRLVTSNQTQEASRYLLGIVTGASGQVQRVMWEAFVKMSDKSTQLKKILEEIQEKGTELLHNVYERWNEAKCPQKLGELFETQNNRLAHITLGAVERLDLSNFILNPLECAVLSHVLQPCDTINTLTLYKCNIGAEGIQPLVPALHKCRNLWLTANNLGDSGVKSLCEALRNPECKVQSLWLRIDSLTDGCTDDLVSALSTSRSLKELNLNINSFTDASVPALRRLILTCTSLERIWLNENQFSSDGERQLRSLEESRAGLTVFV